MNDRSSDPLDELRHADPVRSTRAPSESKARVWARIQEATVDTTSKRSRGGAWALGLGAVAAVTIAAVAVLANLGGSAPDGDPAPRVGLCVENYDLATLANREFAFDGTVTALNAERATFVINDSFWGGMDGSVTLDAPGMTGGSITTAGGPPLVEGARLLVAGDGQFVWGCGFTQPYDETVAADWAEVDR